MADIPSIYFFNPTAELSVANGDFSYQPSALLRQFEREMAAIMLYFASEKDLVVVDDYPDEQFLNTIRQLKPHLPGFIKKTDLECSQQSFDKLVPWGWSPAVINEFQSLFPRFSPAFNASGRGKWKNDFALFYNRKKATGILDYIYENYEGELPEKTILEPLICKNCDIANELLKQKRQIVFKAPLSSSGRGIQMLRKESLNSSNIAWLKSIINKQGFVMAETLHNKVADVSLHFFKQSGKTTKFIDKVFFKTNSKGQFLGCYTGNHPDPAVNSLINKHIKKGITTILEQAFNKQFENYEGYLGLDMMVIEINGQEQLHPCVEVNPRFTMGLLTLQIKKLIHKKEAFWEMVYTKNGNILKHLKDGSIPLTPITPHTNFGAILHFNV